MENVWTISTSDPAPSFVVTVPLRSMCGACPFADMEDITDAEADDAVGIHVEWIPGVGFVRK